MWKTTDCYPQITKNHSTMHPTSFHINDISENATMRSHSSPLERARLEPIKNAGKSQAKRTYKHIEIRAPNKHPKMTSPGAQHDSKWLQLGSTWANLGAPWHPNGPSIAKTWLNMPPLGYKMAPLGTTLGLLWANPPKSTQSEPQMYPKCSRNGPK